MKRAALFDLDGVIVDSEGSYTSFWDSIDKLYPSGIEDFALAIKGTTLSEILKHYSTDEIRSDITDRIHRFEREEMNYPLYPGVLKFIRQLKAEGIQVAIVTSSDDTKMSYLWKHRPELRELADIIITGSMVSHSKPNPEGYLTAAEMLGCNPSDCWVFEDSLQGLEAGNRAGCKVIGLATTNPRELIEPMARMVIDGWEGMTPSMLP